MFIAYNSKLCMRHLTPSLYSYCTIDIDIDTNTRIAFHSYRINFRFKVVLYACYIYILFGVFRQRCVEIAWLFKWLTFNNRYRITGLSINSYICTRCILVILLINVSIVALVLRRSWLDGISYFLGHKSTPSVTVILTKQ